MQFLRWYLVSTFVVFLHFAMQVRSLTHPQNRYKSLWDRTQAIGLVADLLLLPLLLAAIGWAVDRLAARRQWPMVRHVFRGMFLLLFFHGVVSAMPSFLLFSYQGVVEASGLAAMFMLGWWVARRQSGRLLRYAVNVCLVFSLAPFILSAQILTWQTWGEAPRTDVVSRQGSKDCVPVFVFVFDMLSYHRSISGGQFRPELPNLRTLSERSVLFDRCYSSSTHSSVSLPRIIYQTDWEPDYESVDGRIFWVTEAGRVPTTDASSLFSVAREHGYNTYMMGWAMPYSRLLGDQVDWCVEYPDYPRGDHYLSEMGMAAVRNIHAWQDPASRFLARWLSVHNATSLPFRTQRYSNERSFRRRAATILDSTARNTFGVFHAFPPHYPYVWNEDGSYRAEVRGKGQSDGYLRNLIYTDTYVGDIVRRLTAAGLFDDALLVLTGDHSWRIDPAAPYAGDPEWPRHVPLLIKLPGQRQPYVVERPIANNQLRPLFEAVLDGERDTSRLVGLLRGATVPRGAGSVGRSRERNRES